MTALLTANNLVLHSADGRVLLNRVSLQLRPAEVLGVIGPNGAGKTSLLKVLAALLPATSGDVQLNGQSLPGLMPSQRARELAYLEQRPQLHWPLRVQHVVELARLAFGDRHKATGVAAVTAALSATGAAAFVARDFRQLSEGEKLLVNLTRALAGEPRLLLADEPTAALDPAHQHSVMQLLRRRAAAGMGVVVILHDLTLAARYCDRLLLLNNGAVMAEGAPAEVLSAANLQQAFQIRAQLDSATNTVVVAGHA